jgi:hypothetical protein
MKLYRKNIKVSFLQWVTVISLASTTALYSCDNNQAQQEQNTNLGEQQKELEVDTTASAGRGGTEKSLGRAADTVGLDRKEK